MTNPAALPAVLSRFHAEVDSAVTRARRAAAEARETSAAFRAETEELVAPVPSVTRPDDDDEDYSQQRIVFDQ